MYHVHLRFFGGPLDTVEFVIVIDAMHPMVEEVYQPGTPGKYIEDRGHRRTDDWRHFIWKEDSVG